MISAVVLACAVTLVASARADDETREARKEYEQGLVYYNAGEFDRAIDYYRHAYLRSPAPGLLFNIAQAYRAKRDAANALYFYEAYLRADPTAPERPFVEARMSELRAQPPPVRDDPGRSLRTAGMITTAAGGALVVTGLVFAIEAHGAFDDVAMGDDPADGKRAEIRSIVFTTAGFMTMITGAVMIHAGSRIAPVVTQGGAGVSLSGSF